MRFETLSAVPVLLAATLSAQSPISWTVADINDASDVSTRGAPCIAVNLGPEVCERVVNGVHFQADRSHWTRKIQTRGGTRSNSGIMYFPSWTTGGYTLKAPYNRTAGGIGARHTTDVDYDYILKDGRHSSPGARVAICQIEGLTPGLTYEIQLFYGNKGRPQRISEWDDGMGNGPGAGGIYLRASGTHFGQVATGVFTATGTGVQTFSNYQHPASGNIPETHNAISAIQVRCLNPQTLEPRAFLYGEGTPGTNTQPNIGGTACSPGIAFIGSPAQGATVLLTAENSQDVASAAALVVGVAPASTPLLGGTLLVNPLFAGAFTMPAPFDPYVHDHEFQFQMTVPQAPGTSVFFQVLQIDPGAGGGVSMSAGVQVDIGL